MTPKQIYERIRVNYRDAFQELMTKMCCIKALWPEGWAIRLRIRNQTPSAILPNLLFDPS